jgi:sugar phosphate isomerase/epimerase
MPLAFSTLGCPDAHLDEVIALAHTNCANGVELRAGADQLVHVGLTARERGEMRARLESAGLTVPAIASYVRVCEPGDDEKVVTELAAHLQLARDLGAGGVRVFPGPDGPGEAGDRRAIRRLETMAPHAMELGVAIYFETHDSHPRGADAARILAELDMRCPGHPVRVIWDLMHPWRAGEGPAQTYAAIEPWFEYVQFKDSVSGPGGVLTLVGEGDLPLVEVATLCARRAGMWWSLEWEKAWHPQLPGLAVALAGARAWYVTHVAGAAGAHTG